MAVTRGQLLLQELAAGKEFVFIMEEGLSSQSDGHCSGTDGKLQSQGGGGGVGQIRSLLHFLQGDGYTSREGGNELKTREGTR